jgi:NitT/TauT family transport system ATP-binding protein
MSANVAARQISAVGPSEVEFSNLRMDYFDDSSQPLCVLDDINFRAAAGEFVSIVGTSGCGKTTLLKIAAGLVSPTSGRITIRGQDVIGATQDIGFVFQSAVLLRWRSILENILLQAEVRKLDMAEYTARARRLLELVGLSGFENKYPYQLSGGMQQRASICRALVHEPSLLLMDEPFGALDAMTRESMHMLLQHIWQTTGKTVLFVTHSISEAVFLSNRVIVLSSRPGRIREVVEIDLPHPRRIGIEEDVRFGRLVNRIRKLLDVAPFDAHR